MKTKILLLAVLTVALCMSAVAQTPSSGNEHEWKYELRYDKTNYSSSTNDTTAWFMVEPFRELAAVLQSTDSANADFYFQARNSAFINTLQYTTFQDSLKLADSTSGSANMNTGGIRNTLLKTTTLNRLLQPGNNQVRIVVIPRATLNGTTTGRRLKVWMIRTN